ncbi:MAG: serpin family protein [bacterium]|nr:serpin family protein [bacterium]
MEEEEKNYSKENDTNVIKNDEENDKVNKKESLSNNVVKKNNKKNVFIIIVILLSIIVITVAICFGLTKPSKNDNKEIITESKEISKYRLSSNSLEPFDLYFLQLENIETNKIYSPLSIKYALEMLAEGAKGNSKLQLDSIIGDYKAKKYTNSSNMSFANAMFVNNSYKDNIKSDYLNKLVQKYNAEVVYDSFKSADTINNWTSKKTLGLINKLFDDVSMYNFILINALGIDMEWNNLIQSVNGVYSVEYSHENFSTYIWPIMSESYSTVKFDNKKINAKAVEIGAVANNYDIVNEIGEDKIRKTVGEEYKKWLKEEGYSKNNQDVDKYLDEYIEEIKTNYKTVSSSTDFLFYVDDSVKAFAKDLKTYNNTTLQYIGIMPKTDSLNKYIENTNISSINDIINGLKSIKLENFENGKITHVTGYIPLFKFDYELNLMSDLNKLGVTDVFDIDKADLSNMLTDGNACIGKISHKSNIEFSNEGIKAAAVTPDGGMGSATEGFEYLYDVPVEIIDLTFDNPYMFLIRDKNSGEVWFVGTVYEPIIYNNSIEE